ncbi:hypothetical protein ACLKA7_015203 [Drosophila subpalustris]
MCPDQYPWQGPYYDNDNDCDCDDVYDFQSLNELTGPSVVPMQPVQPMHPQEPMPASQTPSLPIPNPPVGSESRGRVSVAAEAAEEHSCNLFVRRTLCCLCAICRL